MLGRGSTPLYCPLLADIGLFGFSLSALKVFKTKESTALKVFKTKESTDCRLWVFPWGDKTKESTDCHLCVFPFGLPLKVFKTKESTDCRLWVFPFGLPLKVFKTRESTDCRLLVFPFGLTLKVFKTRILGKSFYTLIKNGSLSFPIDVGSHNPPPLRPASSVALVFFSHRCGTPPHVHPPLGLSLITHIVRCLALIPFVTSQAHRWQILSFLGFHFGLLLKVFKTCLLGRCFHTFI